MAKDTDLYDFFVSYARADNADGWVERFLEALLEEHSQFTGGRTLTYFFDKQDIQNFTTWKSEIFNKGLTKSRLFLAFLSPSYFASKVCRQEWKAWIDQEIARHILTAGAAPIYFVEVPGFVSKPMLSEHEVAQKVAELCQLPKPHEQFESEVSPVVSEFRRRQLVTWMTHNAVQPFYYAGIVALQQADLRNKLRTLAEDLEQRSQDARRGAESDNTVPPYNEKFSGRMEELIKLRAMLKDNRTGVVCGIHGLGGIGKTELAFTYAHAFASVYPGGRFLIPCEYKTNLRDAALHLGELFRDQISDEERKSPETYFSAITACLRERLERLGSILLVLDNVSDSEVVSRQQTDALTALGPQLHLLATTRLLPPSSGNWLTLGELAAADALQLLEKHRGFASDHEHTAAMRIVKRLGGFALAIELVAAWLKNHPETTYAGMAEGIGLADLEEIAGSEDMELRRHNHERRLTSVMSPVLEGLSAAEKRVMEYAAFLPPDYVPLRWLKTLVMEEFPELVQPGKLSDPWLALCRRLERLALFTRVEEETTSGRMVRVHRLVQDLMRRDLSMKDLHSRQRKLQKLIEARDAELEKTTDWQTARWELEPLDALALLWDEAQHPWASWLANQIGLRWVNLAQWSRAEPLLRRALAIDEQSFGADHPDVARDLNHLAQLLQATNRLTEAKPLMRRALAIVEQCYGAEHPYVANCLNSLAAMYYSTNRLAEAEPLMRRALDIDEQFYGTEHPNVAIRLNNLAQLLQDTNRLVEAEPLMRRALAIDELSYGAEHPKVAIRLNNLAALLQATNRQSEAEPLLHRALAIDKQFYGTEHPNVAIDLNNLARLLQNTDRLTEAEPLMRRALAIDEQFYGAEHPVVGRDLNNLSQLLQTTDRLAEAEPLMRRALTIDEHSYGADHPNVALKLNNLAFYLKATKRPGESIPLFQRAIEILEANDGAYHPGLGAYVKNLGEAFQDLNQLTDALSCFRRALDIGCRFLAESGHKHPVHAKLIKRFHDILLLMGCTEQETQAELDAVSSPYGLHFHASDWT